MGPKRHIDQKRLTAAYAAWPGSDHDKSALKALLLRLRIEDVASGLPSTVIAAGSGSTHIRQRLMLAVGEPGLTPDQRIDRLRVVITSGAAYEDICQVLHGRIPDGRPPLADVKAWEDTVKRLEENFDLTATLPQQRIGNKETKVH